MEPSDISCRTPGGRASGRGRRRAGPAALALLPGALLLAGRGRCGGGPAAGERALVAGAERLWPGAPRRGGLPEAGGRLLEGRLGGLRQRSRWPPRTGLRRAGTSSGSAPSPGEWFQLQGSRVTFGAATLIDTELSGPPELAHLWLLGDGERDDSVDRLVRAARPVGAEVRRATELEDQADGVKLYALELPVLEIPGLGKARSSITMRGAVCSSGGPQPDGGPFLDIGTVGDPRATLAFAAGPEVDLPTFNLNVTGALGVDEAAGQASRAVGWVTIDIQAEVPSFGLFTVPEEVLRPAAQEVCRQTVGYASRRLELELTKDFARWRGDRVRAERAGLTKGAAGAT